jgi:hypothetical protein
MLDNEFVGVILEIGLIGWLWVVVDFWPWVHCLLLYLTDCLLCVASEATCCGLFWNFPLKMLSTSNWVQHEGIQWWV